MRHPERRVVVDSVASFPFVAPMLVGCSDRIGRSLGFAFVVAAAEAVTATATACCHWFVVVRACFEVVTRLGRLATAPVEGS